MIQLLAALATFAGQLFAATEPNPSCPDLSGLYSDRDLFLERFEQNGCTELAISASLHPKNKNPPQNYQPGTRKFVADCRKHEGVFQMESVCWNGEVLEVWTYGKSFQGGWVPFMIRRIRLAADGSGVHDDAYLTDASGAERKYLQGFYRREAASAP